MSCCSFDFVGFIASQVIRTRICSTHCRESFLFNAMLHIAHDVRTGARWCQLPDSFVRKLSLPATEQTRWRHALRVFAMTSRVMALRADVHFVPKTHFSNDSKILTLVVLKKVNLRDFRRGCLEMKWREHLFQCRDALHDIWCSDSASLSQQPLHWKVNTRYYLLNNTNLELFL